jgi:hypothetical protein
MNDAMRTLEPSGRTSCEEMIDASVVVANSDRICMGGSPFALRRVAAGRLAW